MSRLIAALPAVALRLMCAVAVPLSAHALVVTNANDSGAGSLRDALMNAPDGDTITFNLPSGSVIALISAPPAIDRNLTITGPGADQLSIERSFAAGTPQFSVFTVTGESVTISRLTITNGSSSDFGGGVYHGGLGTLNLTSCTVSGNSAAQVGGGVYNSAGTLNMTSCVISGNTAGVEGAGIFTNGAANLTSCRIENNAASGNACAGAGLFSGAPVTVTVSTCNIFNNKGGSDSGGGIFNLGSDLEVTNSILLSNSAVSGGGIYNQKSATITNSTLAENTATTAGGGAYNYNGTLTIVNSTISDNTAKSGGGIGTRDTINLTSVTIAGNTAGYGGGIYVEGGTASSRNSLIAKNTGNSGAPDVYGTLTSNGFTLVGHKDQFTTIAAGPGDESDQIGTDNSPIDPRIGLLQFESNTSSLIRPLLFGSPAIDKGGDVSPYNTDQAGFTRPIDLDNSIYPNANRGNGNDIGAYEAQFALPPPPKQNVCAAPPKNLVSWWPFEGNGADLNNANNLVLSGLTNYTTGEVGRALSFASGNVFARASASNSLNVGPSGFTIDAWINPKDVTTHQPLFEWNTGDTSGATYGAHWWLANTFGPGVGPANLYVSLVDTNGISHIFSSAPNLVRANTWQHVALTYDPSAGVGNLYYDGTLVAQEQLGTFIPQTSYDFYIGFRPSGDPSASYTGQMDEVELFNRALTAVEIQTIYNAGGFGKCKTGQVNHFSVTVPSSATAGTPFNFTVTALDVANNVVTGYNGTVHFTSSDGQATLPGDTALANGTGTFPATLRTSGNQTISATDSVATGIIGTSNSITVSGAPTPTPSPSATPSVTPTPTPPSQLQNLSTRKQVGTADNVLIGGFIVVGTDDKKVLLRALGPSLPVNSALADPTLELHASDTTLLAANDNWHDAPNASEIAAVLPPTSDLESAILTTLGAKPAAQGGAGYTGVLAGSGGTTGIGLLEIYDLNSAANSQLANISTRGFVGTGDDLLIGGFIPGPSDRASLKVLVRALGPSLAAQGVSGVLQDPVLELHDANGILLQNDNWRDASNADEIQATLPPPDDRESAIITTLAPSTSGYTAVIRGVNDETGVALVEVYALD